MKVAVGITKSQSVLDAMVKADFVEKPLLSGEKDFLTLAEITVLNSRLLALSGDGDCGDKVAKELSKLELYYEDRSPAKAKRTPEEEAAYRSRIESLKIKAEQREYANMTMGMGGGISEAMAGHNAEKTSIAAEMNKLSSVTAIATNMILAPLTFGAFLYFFVSSRIFTSPTYQILCSIVGGVAMMFVEMTLFVIRSDMLIEHDEKKKKEGEVRVQRKNMAVVEAKRKEGKKRD
ncbi:hypothetical protein TrVE_jg154 [Triparma verrucosa]|uniref:Uncharacterized protein n=1 Tax=Triparma verrucosa TaxID=1606542 RepID=A0A9W7CH33_9STRA|nr:hypothetical protein TrVE_jg154 [Triparma verrucosa]